MFYFWNIFSHVLFFSMPPLFIYWMLFHKKYLSGWLTITLSTGLGYVLGNLAVWTK